MTSMSKIRYVGGWVPRAAYLQVAWRWRATETTLLHLQLTVYRREIDQALANAFLDLMEIRPACLICCVRKVYACPRLPITSQTLWSPR